MLEPRWPAVSDPAKREFLPAERNRADGILDSVFIDRERAIIEIRDER